VIKRLPTGWRYQTPTVLAALVSSTALSPRQRERIARRLAKIQKRAHRRDKTVSPQPFYRSLVE
jgi:hypothetical protein